MKSKKNFWEDGAVKNVSSMKKNLPEALPAAVGNIEDLPELYDVNQAAAYLKVNKYTIYHWKGLWIEAETDRPTRFTAQQLEDCKVRLKNRTPLNKRKHG